MSDNKPDDDVPWYATAATGIFMLSAAVAFFSWDADVLKGGALFAICFYLFFAIPHWLFLYFRWRSRNQRAAEQARKAAETEAAHEAYERRKEQEAAEERREQQAKRRAEQEALEQEIEEERAAEQLTTSIKIIKEAVRPIAAEKDNSTMLSLIDEELAKIAADEGLCAALSTDDEASETLRLCQRLLHEKGQSDPFLEKHFQKLFQDTGRPDLQIVKNS